MIASSKSLGSFALIWLVSLAPLGCGDDGSSGESGASGDEAETSSSSSDESTATSDESTDETGTSESGDDEGACASASDFVEKKAFAQTHAGYGVAIAGDGRFAIVGKLESELGNDDDAWLAMYEPDGSVIWAEVVDGGAGSDFAQSVVIDGEGNLVWVGSQGSDPKALWVEKRAGADGALAWSHVEAPQFMGDNVPGDIALAPDGAVVVSATLRAGDKDSDIALLELAAADGTPQWTTSYSGVTDANGFSIDRAGPLGIASDGSISVGGSEGVDADTKEAVVLRFGPEGGSPSWQLSPHADAGAHIHGVSALAVGPSGETYFAVQQSTPATSFWLHRASAAGSLEWELAAAVFEHAPTSEWNVTSLELALDGTLTVAGRLIDEEVGQGISWSEAWMATLGLDGVGQCLASHTWKNAHIIPASTIAYAFAEGPAGAIAVGEVVDGPENYYWFGAFE
jgi:hypothetical protein